MEEREQKERVQQKDKKIKKIGKKAFEKSVFWGGQLVDWCNLQECMNSLQSTGCLQRAKTFWIWPGYMQNRAKSCRLEQPQ